MADIENDNANEIDVQEFKFALVEISQLEKLLQRCINCGKLPGRNQTGKDRDIKWTKSGNFLS